MSELKERTSREEYVKLTVDTFYYIKVRDGHHVVTFMSAEESDELLELLSNITGMSTEAIAEYNRLIC